MSGKRAVVTWTGEAGLVNRWRVVGIRTFLGQRFFLVAHAKRDAAQMSSCIVRGYKHGDPLEGSKV